MSSYIGKGKGPRWKRLRRARNLLSYNPAQMAAVLGVTEHAYGLWEMGDAYPPVGAVWRAEELASAVPPWLRPPQKGPGRPPASLDAYCDGTKTAKEVAQLAGVTAATVCNHVRRREDLSLKAAERVGRARRLSAANLPALDNGRAAFIKEMREKGATLEEVGEALGITRERVRQLELRLGLLPRLEVKQLQNGTAEERAERRRAQSAERKAARAKRDAENIEAIEAMLKAGLSLTKAAAALGLKKGYINTLSKGRQWGKLSKHGRWRDEAPSQRKPKHA